MRRPQANGPRDLARALQPRGQVAGEATRERMLHSRMNRLHDLVAELLQFCANEFDNGLGRVRALPASLHQNPDMQVLKTGAGKRYGDEIARPDLGKESDRREERHALTRQDEW